MATKGKNTRTLKVRIDADLFKQMEVEIDRLLTDMSTYVRWCIRTGLYLKDLNSFVRSKEVRKD
jgi:hypothetical protein